MSLCKDTQCFYIWNKIITNLYFSWQVIGSGRGISPQPSHRTVHESLPSHGSSCSITGQLRPFGHWFIGTNCDFISVNSLFPFYWLDILLKTNKPNPLLLFHYKRFFTTTIWSATIASYDLCMSASYLS